MSLSVDYIYKFCLNLIRKNQSGGVDDIEFATFWHDKQLEYQADMLGRFQARNNGKTGTNTGLIQDETIMQKLSPFIIPGELNIISGKVAKPNDFIYRLAFRINGKDAYKIDHNQISKVNDDSIDPPSIVDNSFYFVEYEKYYSLLPNTLPTTNITIAEVDYISVPKKIVWGYIFDADGRQVYSRSGLTGLDVVYGGVGYTTPTITFSAPATGGVQATGTLTVVSGIITEVVITNVGEGYAGLTPTFTITGSNTTPANFGEPIVSVDPLWDETSCIEITKRMLTDIGISFKDNDFIGFGKSVTATGE